MIAISFIKKKVIEICVVYFFITGMGSLKELEAPIIQFALLKIDYVASPCLNQVRLHHIARLTLALRYSRTVLTSLGLDSGFYFFTWLDLVQVQTTPTNKAETPALARKARILREGIVKGRVVLGILSSLSRYTRLAWNFFLSFFQFRWKPWIFLH